MSTHHSVTFSVLAISSLASAGCSVAPDHGAGASQSGEVLTAKAASAAVPRQATSGVTTREDDDGDSSGIGLKLRPAVHAELDAFGCEAADHGVFAGRYSSINVFADMASLGPDRLRTDAKVFGHITVGFPDLLSGAYILWDLSWLSEDDTVLLYGSALTPIGDTVVARMVLPRDPGVHATTINTTNMTSGAVTNDLVNCTIR